MKTVQVDRAGHAVCLPAHHHLPLRWFNSLLREIYSITKKRSTARQSSAQDVVVPSALSSAITAVSYEGLSVSTSTGEAAALAVIDRNGRIIDAGPAVARAVWDVAIAAYRNFLMGTGHLRVLTKPPGAQS